MKLTFYLQYFSYDDEKFNADDNYYRDSNDYIKQLEESYNQTKDVIFEAMMSGSYNTKDTYKIALQPRSHKSDKFDYAKCEGLLYDVQMNEEDINSLLGYFATQDVAVFLMKLDGNTMVEEFETNWSMFLDSSKKIMEYPTDEEWKFTHKPCKDIYFSLKNNANETVYGKMINCRIESTTNLFENVIIAEKIVFIKSLE